MGDTGKWDAELVRREGPRMVEWIAYYLVGGAREMPVLAQVEPVIGGEGAFLVVHRSLIPLG